MTLRRKFGSQRVKGAQPHLVTFPLQGEIVSPLPPGSYTYAGEVKHCSKQQVWCHKTTYFHPPFIMNRCHIWNYDTIMINTSVPLCDAPSWCHDDITVPFLPLLSCRSSTRPAGPCSGPPSPPSPPHTPPSVLTPLSPGNDAAEPHPLQRQWGVCEGVRMWGWCMCVCLHVSVWRGRENLGYWATYLSSHKSVLKIYSPYFLCSLCSSCASWKSHCVSMHYNEMWSGGLCCSVQYEKGFTGKIPIWIFHSYTGPGFTISIFIHVLGT